MSFPTDTEYFVQRTALGDAVFVVTFRYNSRMDRWLVDVADANLKPLLYGIPILGAQGITSRFRGIIPGVPKGFWAALDMTGAGRDPQEFTLGGDLPLLYQS